MHKPRPFRRVTGRTDHGCLWPRSLHAGWCRISHPLGALSNPVCDDLGEVILFKCRLSNVMTVPKELVRSVGEHRPRESLPLRMLYQQTGSSARCGRALELIPFVYITCTFRRICIVERSLLPVSFYQAHEIAWWTCDKSCANSEE